MPHKGSQSNVVSCGAFKDVVIVNLRVSPDTVVSGEEIIVSLNVKNDGTDTITGSYREDIYFSKDATLDVSDIKIGSSKEHTADLSSGNVFAASIPATIPKDADDGTWIILVQGDADDNIPESNEPNNVTVTKIIVNNNSTEPTPKPTVTSKETPTPGPSPTVTPKETPTPKPRPTVTSKETPTPGPSPTVTPKETPTPKPRPTVTPKSTPTPVLTPLPTVIPTETPSITPDPSSTPPTKSFTFACDKEFDIVRNGIERLILNLGGKDILSGYTDKAQTKHRGRNSNKVTLQVDTRCQSRTKKSYSE